MRHLSMTNPDMTDGQPPPPSQRWLAMLGVGVGILMVTIDFSIVNVSLPTLVEELQTNFATVQWVVLSYVLIITSLMLGAARLGDIMGMKRLYAGGVAMFTLGSLLCGLSPSVGWLIGARAFQGLGAVFMQSLGMAIITQVFPANERGRALGWVGGIVSVGLSLGPALGGIIIGALGWRWVFLINVPLGMAAWFMVARFVPRAEPASRESRFDAVGALILCCALTAYSLGMTLGQRVGFGRSLVLFLLALALASTWLFVLVERRTKEPMIDLGLFVNPLFGINLVMGLLTFVTLGMTLVLPFFMELVMRLSTMQTGLLMMVVPLCMGLISPFSGRLTDRHGPRVISLVGLLVMAAGCAAMSTVDHSTGMWELALKNAPVGLGMGLFQSPNNTAIMSAAPANRLGVASGLLALSRTLGSSTGVPLGGALFTATILAAAGLSSGAQIITAPPDALVAGVRFCYAMGTGLALAAAFLSATAWRIARKRRTV